jgi:hypothetical protein
MFFSRFRGLAGQEAQKRKKPALPMGGNAGLLNLQNDFVGL